MSGPHSPILFPHLYFPLGLLLAGRPFMLAGGRRNSDRDPILGYLDSLGNRQGSNAALAHSCMAPLIPNFVMPSNRRKQSTAVLIVDMVSERSQRRERCASKLREGYTAGAGTCDDGSRLNNNDLRSLF